MTLHGQSAAWRAISNGVAIRFRLTPKSNGNAIEAIIATADGPAFRARVRAVPEDGAANTALARIVAVWLGVSKSSVSVTAGQKSRVKTITVAGDPERLACVVSEHARRRDDQTSEERS